MSQSHRSIAVRVGLLFMIATLAGVLSLVFLQSLYSSDYLVGVAASASQVVLGVFAEILMVGAVLAIPVVLYPVLRGRDATVARAYLVARIFEASLLVASIFGAVLLLALSRDYAAVGAGDIGRYQTIGALLLTTSDWGSLMGGQIVLSLSAVILNAALYRRRLVPRILSAWGVLGAPLMFASAALVMFDVFGSSSTPATILMLPLAVQEMALALWLIFKGFHPEALATD
jgi:hypothetical protein